MRISDWSSDVCSSDLHGEAAAVDLVAGGELPELEALQFVDQRRLVADVGFVEGGRPRVDRIGKKVRVPRGGALGRVRREGRRSEEHTSELQSLMRTSYAVFCLKYKIFFSQVNYYPI